MLTIHPTARSRSGPGLATAYALPRFIQREERLRFIAHELSHRTKNLLAVVQSIANQTASRSASLKDFQAVFGQRLQGLSRSLDLLVEEDGRGAWIGDLVRNQLEPFGDIDGMRISATGPAVFLYPEAAQNIGLALHELATNASKHGALSVPQGIVAVHWDLGRADPTGFRLVWRELNGPKVTPPTHRGFGYVVLQRMMGQALHGKTNHDFGEGGITWTIEVTASAVMRGPDRADA
jgi:two-component sensor histidine kinase